jgi:hypothetical protein
MRNFQIPIVRVFGVFGVLSKSPDWTARTSSRFQKLQEFQQVTLKVLRWEERDKRLVINDAELVP